MTRDPALKVGAMPSPEKLLDAGTDLVRFTLTPDVPVVEARRSVARNGVGVGVVVDDQHVVVGTITDGDLRRAALGGCGDDTPVSEVMSRRAVTVAPTAPEDEIRDVIARHRLRAVPVVERGELAGIRYLEGLPPGRTPRRAVIMAGGRGIRLRPVTDKVPKPLLRVGGKSIVERLVGGLARAGVDEVFLAVNYKAEVFEQRLGTGEGLGVRLGYLREETAMGTAGALSLLPPGDGAPLLVANGDILTTLDFSDLFEFHWRHGGAITVAGVEYRSSIPYGVLRNVEHHLLAIDEKPERRDFCSAGIYVLESDVLGLLAPDEPLGMPDLIALVLAEGRPVNVFPILEDWYDIGETSQFERVLVEFATSEHD